MVAWDGTVEQLFFHPLIAYPELAFDGDAEEDFIASWFVTVSEFKAILNRLYEGGYVLVSVYDTFSSETRDGKQVCLPKSPTVPAGKKPLILTMDDLNYYPITVRNGTNRRLDLDVSGNLSSWTRLPDGREVVSADNEIPMVLESFIADHPDFSVNGARGIIALTGYYGFFGHASQNPAARGYDTELAAAKAVAGKLRSLGWFFADHSWGHRHIDKQTDELFVAEEKEWKKHADPILGPTDLYIFPFGEVLFANKPRFDFLKSEGYRVFFTVMGVSGISRVDDVLRYDRIPVDGRELRAARSAISRFFDRKSVLDPVRGRPKEKKAAVTSSDPTHGT